MATHDDNVQHGLDDNASGDAGKGAALGGLGGAAVGAAAGSLIGPVGTLIGAAVGALSGAVASGAAVAAVDAVDNDNTVSGVGTGATGDVNNSGSYMSGAGGEHGHNVVTGDQARTDAGAGGLTTGALAGGVLGAAVGGPLGAVVGGTAGSLLGGVAGDASETVADGDATRRNFGATTGTPNMSQNNRDLDPSLVETTNSGMTSGVNSTLPRVSRDEYNRLDADGRTRVQLIEEELHVGKEQRELGQVEVSKRVIEEQVSVPVTLEREELVITRKAGSGQDVVGGSAFTDEVITVPIREEFATVNKTAHVAEEIEIEKRTTQQQTTVGGTVRREELDVQGDAEGRVHIEGDVNRNA